MVDLNKQRICIKFHFNFGKTATNTYKKMLKNIFMMTS